MDDLGIAGAVFSSGVGEIVRDAYADPRFHRDVDGQTDYTTRSLVCAPIRNARASHRRRRDVEQARGRVRGARPGAARGPHRAVRVTLETLHLLERMSRERQREVDFLNVVSDLASELELTTAARAASSPRRHDARLRPHDAVPPRREDRRALQLRRRHARAAGDPLPEPRRYRRRRLHLGAAIRIPHAYADLRFNPAFDRQTGYFTRCILCVPIFNKAGKAIGVTQSLNKSGGAFTPEDESRLRAFTAPSRVASRTRSSSPTSRRCGTTTSHAQSMSNGVITFDEDGRVSTCNTAASRILRREESELVGTPAEDVFRGSDVARGADPPRRRGSQTELAMDAELAVDGDIVSANVTVLPLLSSEEAQLGTLVMIEDISSEKRVQARRSPATWTPTSPTCCSQPAPRRACSAEGVACDRALLRHPQLHDAGGAARAHRRWRC